MSHLKHIVTAYSLRHDLKRYIKEKNKSLNADPSGVVEKTTNKKQSVAYMYLRNTKLLQFFRILWYCLCSFILTYLVLIGIIFHFKFHVMWGLIICSILGMILGLYMNKNEYIRCYVFLALPQVTSKYGRKALIAYCYMLLLIGPTKNILVNIGHVAQTISCAQNHVREEFKKLEKALKEPLLEAKHALEKIIKAIERSVKSVTDQVRKVERIAKSIFHAFEKAGEWLASNLNICKKTLGTPFQRCKMSFDRGIAACKAKIGPILGIYCNVDYLLEGVCYVFKSLDYFCEFVHFIEDTVLVDIKQKLKTTIDQIEEFFYVEIHFEDDIVMSWNTSVKPSEMIEDVLWGLKANLKASILFISWFGSLTMLILVIIFLRVLWYHKKFLTKDRFDNVYITDDFVKIDLESVRRFEHSVLPLKSYEKYQYIRYSSFWLNGTEKLRFVRSSVVLLFTCIKICLFLLVDYFIYWLLNAIYTADIYNEEKSALHYGGLEVNVEGKGFQTDIYRIIGEEVLKFDYILASFEFKSCLIQPSVPDYDLYLHIAITLTFCWVAIIIEPYILRLRNHLMCQMYPRRSKERAFWLFQKILRERDRFFNLAHRQLRHIFSTKKDSVAPMNEYWSQYIARKVLPRSCYEFWISLDKSVRCLQCRSTSILKHCSTYNCMGIFCGDCWNHFSMKCPLCSVVESDFSEEIDSEDEDAVNAKIEKHKINNLEDEGVVEEDEEITTKVEATKDNNVYEGNYATSNIDFTNMENHLQDNEYASFGQIEIEYFPSASQETINAEGLVIIVEIENENQVMQASFSEDVESTHY